MADTAAERPTLEIPVNRPCTDELPTLQSTAQPTNGRPLAPRGPRPYDRPSIVVRVLIGLASIAFNVALMISDRAPSFTRRIFGDSATGLSNRLDADRRAQAITDGGLPESDAIVHIGVWAVAALLVALTIWSWRGLLLTALAVFAASVLIEVGQGRYSSSRNVEMRDVMSNAAGVLAGCIGAGICFVVWSSLAIVRRRMQSDRRTR